MLSTHIYQLPIIKSSKIFDSKTLLRCSKYITEPMAQYGYHYFVHQNRSKLDILQSEKYKNKDMYKVVNPYELEIPDYDKSILNVAPKYFNMNDEIVFSKSFYNIWEIFMLFDIFSNKNNCLFIGNDDSVRAGLLYQDKLGNKTNKYYVYENEEIKDNRITHVKDINKLSESFNLIVATKSVKHREYNYLEQENYITLMEEIVIALSKQDKGGNFVCKFFEFFTTISIKYLCILEQFYENVILVKPLISDAKDTEIYIICLNYKGENKNVEKLNKLYDEMTKCNKGGEYVNDILVEYIISNEMKKAMTYINCKLMISQYIRISEMMSYIESGNYYGDLYHKYRNTQIEMHDKWLPLFFPLTNQDVEKNKKYISKEVEIIIENNKKEL